METACMFSSKSKTLHVASCMFVYALAPDSANAFRAREYSASAAKIPAFLRREDPPSESHRRVQVL